MKSFEVIKLLIRESYDVKRAKHDLKGKTRRFYLEHMASNDMQSTLIDESSFRQLPSLSTLLSALCTLGPFLVKHMASHEKQSALYDEASLHRMSRLVSINFQL
jgi:hypothetical protein